MADRQPAATSSGPLRQSDPVAAHNQALAALRQATWEATQFITDEAIVAYVQGVLREVESDTP